MRSVLCTGSSCAPVLALIVMPFADSDSNRHLAQESSANADKSDEELTKTKSYASLKNWFVNQDLHFSDSCKWLIKTSVWAEAW